MAGLIDPAGLRTRLFYRICDYICVYRDRKREPTGLGEADYVWLLCEVHTQLRADFHHHDSAVMRGFVDAHDRLTGSLGSAAVDHHHWRFAPDGSPAPRTSGLLRGSIALVMISPTSRSVYSAGSSTDSSWNSSRTLAGSGWPVRW